MLDFSKVITKEMKQEAALANLRKQFESATQDFMDGKAQEMGYDSLLTAISYAEEPEVEQFQEEGRAFRAWRSRVWAYAHEQLRQVMAGEKAQPTVEDFVAGLPELELPA